MILFEWSFERSSPSRLAHERKTTLDRGSSPIYSRYRRPPCRHSTDFRAGQSTARE